MASERREGECGTARAGNWGRQSPERWRETTGRTGARAGAGRPRRSLAIGAKGKWYGEVATDGARGSCIEGEIKAGRIGDSRLIPGNMYLRSHPRRIGKGKAADLWEVKEYGWIPVFTGRSVPCGRIAAAVPSMTEHD